MPYIKCFYHAIWATKHRQPLINHQIKGLLFATIRQKSLEMRCPILELNAVDDHVHVAVCIVPNVAAAEWLRHVKGLSAHAINAQFVDLETTFKWQEGYGLVTFGEKNLPFVQSYIIHQKQHHTKNTTIPKLEEIEEESA
jgi:REP element-mobilizing transposase RayT